MIDVLWTAFLRALGCLLESLLISFISTVYRVELVALLSLVQSRCVVGVFEVAH